MRITALKTMLKTKLVKEFLSNKEHEKVVQFHEYNSLEEFFTERYNYYKENIDDLGFDKLDTKTLLYNIECDMDAMYDDFRRSIIPNGKMCNILIIDDDDKKIDELNDALSRKKQIKKDIKFRIFPNEFESLDFSNKILQLAQSNKHNLLYKYIRDYVKEKSISVVVLDFYLDGDYYTNPINKTDGYFLLKKIREGNDKFSKIPIYSFTYGEESLKKGENLITSGKIQGSIPKSDNMFDDITNQTLCSIQYECKKYNNLDI